MSSPANQGAAAPTEGGGLASNGSTGSTKKHRHPKNLTVMVEEDKNKPYQFSKAGTFTEDDIKISQRGMEIRGAPSPAAEVDSPGISGLDQLEDTGIILGRGSAGLVKLAKLKSSNQLFAVKVIPLDISEDVRKKILLELKALHNAFHESIVTFYGAFYMEGAISIALEFMDAGTLADIMRASGAIPEFVLAKIAAKLLNGVYYIHKHLHLIHRDIKPQNLLVNTRGEVKITDFGVSGKIENTIGKAASFVGTVTYMSPERIVGKHHSTTADIWSLGLTILEAALGRYPYFQANSTAGTTFFQLLESIVQKPVPLPSPEHFSAEFVSFCSQALTKNPDERPTAAKLLNHPWITMYASNASVDVAVWVRSQLLMMGKLSG